MATRDARGRMTWLCQVKFAHSASTEQDGCVFSVSGSGRFIGRANLAWGAVYMCMYVHACVSKCGHAVRLCVFGVRHIGTLYMCSLNAGIQRAQVRNIVLGVLGTIDMHGHGHIHVHARVRWLSRMCKLIGCSV